MQIFRLGPVHVGNVQAKCAGIQELVRLNYELKVIYLIKCTADYKIARFQFVTGDGRYARVYSFIIAVRELTDGHFSWLKVHLKSP